MGRQFKPHAVAMVQSLRGGSAEGHVCFVDDTAGDTVNGIPCLSEAEFLALPCDTKTFSVLISDGAARRAAAQRLLGKGYEPITITTTSTEFYDADHIGAGGVFGRYTAVSANAVIGDFFHCNRGAYMGHDCVIGDYVTFSPRVSCSGFVHIGEAAFIGVGALIRNGQPGRPLTIGEGAVVGMGSVVTKDVPAGATVVGNPARCLN